MYDNYKLPTLFANKYNNGYFLEIRKVAFSLSLTIVCN